MNLLSANLRSNPSSFVSVTLQDVYEFAAITGGIAGGYLLASFVGKYLEENVKLLTVDPDFVFTASLASVGTFAAITSIVFCAIQANQLILCEKRIETLENANTISQKSIQRLEENEKQQKETLQKFQASFGTPVFSFVGLADE